GDLGAKELGVGPPLEFGQRAQEVVRGRVAAADQVQVRAQLGPVTGPVVRPRGRLKLGAGRARPEGRQRDERSQNQSLHGAAPSPGKPRPAGGPAGRSSNQPISRAMPLQGPRPCSGERGRGRGVNCYGTLLPLPPLLLRIELTVLLPSSTVPSTR